MSASLVGSEMCIRDSHLPQRGDVHHQALLRQHVPHAAQAVVEAAAVRGDPRATELLVESLRVG
eukprot:11423292-Alexandrium_andersonii.AAC.1